MQGLKRARGQDNRRLVVARTECQLGDIPYRADVSAPSYEQTVDVETPELVVLTYSIAGIGSRAMAAITDLLLVAAAFVVLGIVWFLVVAAGGFSGFDLSGSWGIALLIIVQFGLLWGYYVLFEGLMDGQTPGKRLHRIRVVREGGYSVTFGTSAVRNLIRIVDMQPVFFYLVGMISVLVTRRGRRLGDIVAGTIVVREDARSAAPAAPSAPARATREQAAALHTQLSEDEYVVLGRFVERWATLDGLKRAALAQQLAARFGAALPDDGRPPGPRLLDLYERERRARAGGVASRGETGAGRERQALIAAGMPALERRSHHVWRRRSGAACARSARTACASSWRSTARCRRISRGCAPRREAARSTSCSSSAGSSPARTTCCTATAACRSAPRSGILFTDGPREVRRSARPIALAALLLFGPATIAAVSVVRTPALASEMLPASMLKRAEDGVQRAQDGRGLHRRSAAVPPRDGVGDHRQQRAGDLRDLRRRRDGRGDVGARAGHERRVDRQRRRAVCEQGDRCCCSWRSSRRTACSSCSPSASRAARRSSSPRECCSRVRGRGGARSSRTGGAPSG